MIGGLILAAGEGRRFGGAKQVAEYGGRPLMAHAMAALMAVPLVERRVVVLGAHADEIRARIDFSDFEEVVCEDWAEGQAASLRAGVRALRDCEAIVVLLADMPGVTPQVVAQVADGVRSGAVALRAVYDGKPGHPVLLSQSLYDDILKLEGDVGARDLLAEVHATQVEVGELARPDDVDTPEELESMSA
ncbi:MAG TPA: nucleotidyltransferase family protein [Solirubrobacteraceae bacterium]